MAIQPKKIIRADADQISLRGLQSFFNVNWLAEYLSDKHSVSYKDRHFAKFQAESIKYCLQQALEYREAALMSSFSKPTLVYYSMMSFALCEILFKCSGDYRLQKLRENHAHHGMELSIKLPASFRGEVNIDDFSASFLPKGTFSVWHACSRQASIFGESVEVFGAGKTTTLRELATSAEPGPVPKKLSLRDLAQNCAAIYRETEEIGLKSRLVRATLEEEHNLNRHTIDWKLIIHPTHSDLLDDVGNRITFSPRCIDLVKPFDFQNGGGFKMTYSDSADYVEAKLPSGFSVYAGQTLFSADDFQLNEFGILYVSSYIAGMFARYYPEYWTRALDSGSQTFQVIDSIMSAGLNRAPLLLLGEFRDRCYLYE